MTVFVFLALIVVVSIIVSIVVATAVIRAPFFDLIGPFSAGLLGAAARPLRKIAGKNLRTEAADKTRRGFCRA